MQYIVTGGHELSGEVSAQGSKNAAFPVIAATLLTNETCEIDNVPDILDVRNFLEILKYLDGEVSFVDHKVRVNASALKNKPLPADLMGRLRGSLVYVGALLARFRKVSFAFPGGDPIGHRPVDVHLDGFRKLGAEVEEGSEFHISADKLKGARIVLGVTSVTGTENLILASVLAEGETTIRLAATEPHVQELCRFLNNMGAKIEGIGTPSLAITGVSKLKGVMHSLCYDEIDAATLAVAAAVTKSELMIFHAPIENLDAPLETLRRMKVNFETGDDYIQIKKPNGPYQGVRIITGVFPQLLTDEQPLLGVLATQAQGKTSIHDWVYEGRQGYLRELQKMGAKVEYDDVHRARIYGPTELHAAEIKTPDIRAGASILIAALIAKGQSIIYNAEIIERGYEKLDERLNSVGANIKRVD